MLRLIYSLRLAFKYKLQLKEYLQNKNLQITKLSALNLLALKEQGILALVLDYDGVLASHANDNLSSEQIEFLLKAKDVFANQVFILSNRITAQRIALFKKLGIYFSVHKSKKPYPQGLKAIMQINNYDKKSYLLIDDRIMTGILLATNLDIKALFLTQPLIDYKKNFLAELYFQALRKLESFLLRVF